MDVVAKEVEDSSRRMIRFEVLSDGRAKNRLEVVRVRLNVRLYPGRDDCALSKLNVNEDGLG